MEETPDRRPSGAVLEAFEDASGAPLTAAEVAERTASSAESAADELRTLADRGLLESRALPGGERVWWALDRGRKAETAAEAGELEDGTDWEDGGAGRQRLLEQHRQLADLAARINVTDDLDEIIQLITEEARELVGAHQSVTSRTVNMNWEQAINAVSLSEKYAEYRDYDTRPDGSGIYSLVCERNETMRMTQEELESHPAWEAFGDEAEEHPPMVGWLAVPIRGSDGENTGMIQLSDKYEGEFTEADEAMLVQLASVAAAAIENARLYDELRDSEERYRTLFESMREGYCVVERVEPGDGKPVEYRYVEANPTFERYTGLSDVDEATVGATAPGDPENWRAVFEEVTETGEVVEFECELESRGRVLRCQAFPIGDAPDGQVGVTVQNVTERVRRERRLEESNERLQQFAHAASHDLQEPLRMVSTYLQLLEDRYGDALGDDGNEFLDYAVDGADRMRAMIDALLSFSRVETQGEPLEPVDLEGVVDAVRTDLQRKIGETDADVTADDLPTVAGDESQLQQVFQNLLDNAIEYAGEEPPEVHVGAERAGPDWLVTVRDEGIGIDPEHREDVFQVFERLHSHDEHPGTGIGLALCERIVERHGGEIWVDSTPGEGSRFRFTLPAADEGE